MLTGMTEQDWKLVVKLFRPHDRDAAIAGERPALPRGAALLHRPQPHLAGATGAIWQLEQRLEAVLASEPVGRVRGLLPVARRAERHGTFGAVFRQHHGARSCFCGRGERGQQDQALGRSRGGFSIKIHLKTDVKGLPLDFHLTGGEASDCVEFETSLDIGRHPAAFGGD